MTLEKTLTSRDEINGAAARRPRRGDRQVGHPRQPRRAEGDRPAGLDPGLDGEADARRPRQARGDPHRRGRQAVADPRPPQGEKESAILQGRGPASRRRCSRPRASRRRSTTVFKAIHAGNADPKLLAYQYLQMLPQIAQGDANKIWIIPSEVTQALGQLGSAIGSRNSSAPKEIESGEEREELAGQLGPPRLGVLAERRARPAARDGGSASASVATGPTQTSSPSKSSSHSASGRCAKTAASSAASASWSRRPDALPARAGRSARTAARRTSARARRR